MDYGNAFDRSDYNSYYGRENSNTPSSPLPPQRDTEREKKSSGGGGRAYGRIQPVTSGGRAEGDIMPSSSSGAGDSDRGDRSDRGNNNKGGFMSKLRAQGDARYKQQKGILTPEDGAKLLTDRAHEVLFPSTAAGAGGVAGGAISDEDQELAESLFGRSARAVLGDSTTAAKGDPSGGTLFGVQNRNEQKEQQWLQVLQNGSLRDIDGDGSGSSVLNTSTISEEEILEMQQGLDAMTDEELEALFRRVRTSLAQSGYRPDAKKKTSNIDLPATLPPTPPVDPTVREDPEKNAQLEAFEEVLQSMYKDPLGVWRDLATNAEKYIEDEDIE